MTSQPPPSFDALLRRFREAASLTQAELAEQSGLSREGISALERNSNRVPRRDTVCLLADALTLSIAERALFAEAARRSRARSSDRAPESSLPLARPGNSPLVGRASELEELRQHLDGVGPPILLLAGEPGIGKTHLLREAAVQARSTGWTVMDGGCLRAEDQQPYAPLLAALEGHVRTCPPALLRAQLRRCSWLVRLLPELADVSRMPVPIGGLSPEQERHLTFTAVGRFLAHAAGPAGTLLVLDDLQWAGLDALDLLTTLIRSEPERPVRVLGAYRSTEARSAHPLMATLAALARDGLVAQTPIGPLAADEASQLLTELLADVSGVDARQIARILRLAGGVPFYLVSFARSVKREATVHAGVPWDAAESIRQRVHALPIMTQTLLRLAAVIGCHIPTSLLLAASGRSELDVLDALNAACQARLLLEDGEDAYRFPHDIVREVLEADLSAGQRRALHRLVVQAAEHCTAPRVAASPPAPSPSCPSQTATPRRRSSRCCDPFLTSAGPQRHVVRGSDEM